MRNLQLLLVTTIIALGISCNPRNQSIPVYHPDFVKHISAYTSGYVDRGDQIKIILAEPVSDKKQDKALKSGLFRFKPQISGTTTFESSTEVVFTPDEKLPRNTVFMAEFNLGKVSNVESKLKRFPMRFETRQQRIELQLESPMAYPDNDPRLRYVKGYINLADVEDLDDLKKCVSVKHDGKTLPVTYFDRRGTRFAFQVDSLIRRKDGTNVNFKIIRDPIEAQFSVNEQVYLHGLGDFKLADVRIENEPDQIINLYFSESLSITQSLKSLVRLDSHEIETMEVKGNLITIYPKQRLVGNHTIQIAPEIKSSLGYPITKPGNRTIFFDKPKPKLRMVGSGTIIPNARGVVFPFEAMALKAVDVYIYQIHAKNIPQFMQINEIAETDQLRRVGSLIYEGKVKVNSSMKSSPDQWERYTLDIGKYIKREPGAVYRVMIGFRRSYTYADGCDDESDYETDNDALYYGYYSQNRYYLKNYDPCDRSFYYSSAIARNILASDLGIIVKAGTDGKHHVFVQDLVSATPMDNVQVKVLNYQNQTLWSSHTNESGMTVFKVEEPFLLVAEKNNQYGYLKLRSGQSKSTSRFDVEGIHEIDGIQGLIYAERGVWRPGDSIYTCFMLRDIQNNLPHNVPVTATLTNPNGTEIFRTVRTSSIGGIYDFRCATGPDAPTGNYRMKVVVGENTFYKTIPVETVQPNRLKIQISSSDSVLTTSQKSKISLNASWLHGAPAPNLRYNVQANIRAVKTRFKGYENYEFDDATTSFSSREQIMSSANLDSNGSAEFVPNFVLNHKSPGRLKVDFIAKVFEKSGAFSTDYSSFEMSTYSRYTGIGAPKTSASDGSLYTDTEHHFPIAHLDHVGNALSGKLNVKIYRIEWRWWWESHRNLANYVQSNSLVPIISQGVETKDGKGQIDFKLAYPNWGQFLMVVNDPESGHSASKVFYVDWPHWRRKNRNTSDDAVVLRLATDKKSYKVGSKINVSIPSGGTGMALVCVENGTSVLKKFWVQTKEKETRVSITADADMAPNAYVHVSFIQKYNQSSNDLPVRTYGIVPIRIDDPGTQLSPVISMKSEIRPDRNNLITISERSGKAMNYTLAVVDEGLLDITHFKTPDPRSHFNRKRGLGVRTWDVYDDVMGAYKGKWANVLSVGGDGSGEAAETKHRVNRFVPAVRFLGPFHLKPGEQANHTIRLENYIGAVRVMVVASLGKAQGHMEKSVKVKKPIMVLPTVPRILTPGEKIAIPITVFNMDDKARKVDVSLKLKGKWKLNTAGKKFVEFRGMGEEVVTFWATVDEAIGTASLEAQISDGKENMKSETELEIRTPNAEVTEAEEYILKPGESRKIMTRLVGIDGSNGLILEASGVPPINLSQRLNELIRYPHGCVEQTTSSVFAQLFLQDFTVLTRQEKIEVKRNIDAALKRLRRFQTSSGGLGYWPGSSHESEWGSNYAGHFITLAKEYGYSVDPVFYAAWLNFQSEKAKSFSNSDSRNHLIQAYRLYTLALAGKPEVSAMNRLREQKPEANVTWRLAAAYAIAGMPEVANKLIKEVPIDPKRSNTRSITYGSGLRDKALILESLVLMDQKSKGFKLLKEVSSQLASTSWLSTQETAYSLIALAGYHRRFEKSKLNSFTYTSNGKLIPVRFSTPYAKMQLKKKANHSEHVTEVKNTGNDVLFVRTIKSFIPTQSDTQHTANHLELKVKYVDYSGKEIDVNSLHQGQELKVIVEIINMGTKGYVRDIAVSHLLPGGWEIQNMRHVMGEARSGFDYRDIRDDRIYSYCSLAAAQSVKYTLPVTATYKGKFYLPNISVEAMYDNSISAKIPGKWIDVVEVNKLSN